MRRSTRNKLALAASAAALSLLFSIPAMAAAEGHLDWANQKTIAGWVWDQSSPETTLEVRIEITPEGSDTAAATLTAAAESYRGDLEASTGSPNHGFFCPVDWTLLSGSRFTVTAYTTAGGEKTALLGTIHYDTASVVPVLSEKTDAAASQTDEGSKSAPGAYGPGVSASAASGPGYFGPGAQPAAAKSTETDDPASSDTKNTESASTLHGNETAASAASSAGGPGVSANGPGASAVSDTAKSSAQSDGASSGWKQGASLGSFTTTGYCNCSVCSSGWGLTYSGTVPKANHTISADINVFPIGTKLMINGIVYTVEDIGSSVNGGRIDIYYDSHEAAVAHGTQTAEVFAVIAE